MKAKHSKKAQRWLRENRDGFAEYNQRVERCGLFSEHLESVQDQFDEQLAPLQRSDAGKRLRGAIRSPANLRRRVKVAEYSERSALTIQSLAPTEIGTVGDMVFERRPV